MQDLSGKTAVVTGAASGIGRALAQRLASAGCNLALWDVNEAELEATLQGLQGAGKVTTALVDVSQRDAVFATAEAVVADHGGVDIVINNAGVVVVDSLENVSFDDFEWVMAVNFWGVVYGVRAFLPHLKRRPEGSIVNISSVNAFLPFPHNGPYNASKYAVCGLTETLHQELAGSPIVALSVHPGGIDTNIVSNARFREGSKPGLGHDAMTRSFAKVARTTPDQAAKAIIGAIRAKERRLLIGADAHVIEAAKRLAPEFAVQLVPWLQRRVLPD